MYIHTYTYTPYTFHAYYFLSVLISEEFLGVTEDCLCTKKLYTKLLLINPRRMREGYSSRSVCVSVCYHASCYIPRLRVQTAVLQGSLWRSESMICVDFAENVLFSSFGVIC